MRIVGRGQKKYRATGTTRVTMSFGKYSNIDFEKIKKSQKRSKKSRKSSKKSRISNKYTAAADAAARHAANELKKAAARPPRKQKGAVLALKQAYNTERDYAKYCKYGQAIKQGPVKDDFCQQYLQIAMGRMDTEEKATTCAALFDKRPDDVTLNLTALCAGVDYTNVLTPFDFDELVQTRLDEDLPAEWCDGLSERAARRQPVCLEIKARKQEEAGDQMTREIGPRQAVIKEGSVKHRTR